jgi:hypothetical protein
LVERAVAVIETFPGVSFAHQANREVIFVNGADLDPSTIASLLDEWWSEQGRGL